jgi:tetratricopeptide (TPR) repeat protein
MKAVTFAIALLLAVPTFLRCRTWQSEHALWEDAARKSPMKARPRLNLALAYQHEGQVDLALAEYSNARALTMGKSDRDSLEIRALAASNAAVIYLQAEAFDQATAILADVLNEYPEFPPAVINMSKILLLAGRPREADRILTDNLTLHPFGPGFTGTAALLYNRALTRAAMGRCAEAAEDAGNAARIDPGLPGIYCN